MDWIVSGLGSDCFKSVVVLTGVVVAIVSIATARSIARKKQSADLLFASRGDERLQEGYKHIREYALSADKNIRSLADNLGSPESRAVQYVMNHFETVSIGIQAKIFDEKMIKQCWCSILIDTYTRTHPLIAVLREKHGKTVLQEFEYLAERWKKSRVKPRTE